MRRLMMTTQGGEGLDPQNIFVRPPAWFVEQGSATCPGAREAAAAERTAEPVSRDPVQIRSITTLL